MNLKDVVKLIFFSIAMSCFHELSAQDTSVYDTQRVYSKNQIQEDFAIFQTALYQAHPGLYRHVSKEKVDKKFIEASKSLTHPMTLFEFGKVISSIVSYIKDGHSDCIYPDNFIDFFLASAKILPLRVVYLHKKLCVIYSPENEIVKGSELLSINNKPVAEIVNLLFTYLQSDGDMQTEKQALLNMRFSLYYYLFIEKAQNFSVEYLTPGNQKKKILIPALSEYKDSIVTVHYKPSRPDYSFEFTHDTVPLLTIISWWGEGFPKFMDSCFDVIKNNGCKNLIIDLRGNWGGADEFGALAYSYLTDKDFRYFTSITAITDSITFQKYTNWDTAGNGYLRKHVNKVGPASFIVPDSNHSGLLVQKPKNNSFLGNLYILINGESCSTTSDFCSIVATKKRGKFVGEETGGNYSGNCSGWMVTLTLPNTKLNIIIPLLKYINAVSADAPKNRGISPDYPFTPSIQDVVNGKDAMMQYTLGLIEKR